ncbi:MAG: CBS domain-containing protein [Ignavibacteriae bacterium]|nr:MAG: CBS domain-containing protein [Ignavibacteriota bacterium]
METLTVKDLMVPLSGYATVSEDATLYEAVKALKTAQKNFDQTRDRHRAILITDKNNRIVGKLSQLDVIRALEPKYLKIDDPQSLSRFGFSQDYLKYTLKEHQLWENALDDICKKAAKLIVKAFMYAPTEGEYVKEDTSLEEAIHLLVMGRHQSLLVTKGKDIMGILRLTDVFKQISDKISSCSG